MTMKPINVLTGKQAAIVGIIAIILYLAFTLLT